MIVLNVDGKTLISVGSWQDIFDIPGYVAPVDSKTHELKNMIARYALPEKNPCGLKNCRTPHNKGYVVLVGRAGAVTNIGNICGKKHFGVDFDKSKNEFDRAVNAQRYRENVATKQNHVPDLLARLDRLRDGETSDRYENMHKYMTRIFDESTSRALRSKARVKDGRVTKAIRLTEDEKDLGLGITPDAEFREELVFTIAGVQAASTYAKLSPRKLDALRGEIDTFSKVDALSLSYPDLKHFNNWANRIDNRFDKLDDIVTDCTRFLTGDNVNNIIANKHHFRRS